MQPDQSSRAVQPELLAALLLTAAYLLLWTGIATLILSHLPGAAGALGALAAIWTALTIGLPLLGSILTSSLSPAPSSIAYVDAQRLTRDAIEADRDAILKRAVTARADLRAARNRIADIDYATELTFLTSETEKRLAPFRAAIAAHGEQQAGTAVFAGYMVPPLGLEAGLATLAGTDDARQRAFEAQARAYQLRLRGILYPLVQREIADPTPMNEPATRGRHNLTDRDILPAFAMTDEPAAARITEVLPFAVWLLVLGCVLAALGLRRAVNWPRDL
jgi:ABC-2 type transport system permease protein